jgi:4-diphosphocytidyl-2-C-methyl-D-erythritol kinase
MMRTAPQHVIVDASAKVNIGWRVGARRADGYHDVSGLLQTISLSDRLEIATDSRDGAFDVAVPGHPELETGSNLVHAAAQALRERVPEPPGTLFVIHKRIPVAAGLGGGSADAAGALIGLSIAWGAKIGVERLIAIGASIGSDVPPLMVGGLVAVSGRGEVTRGVGSFDAGWLVLGVGAEHVPTPAVYELFDEIGTVPSDVLFHNDLEAAACELVPELGERITAMRDATGIAFVSGSGPTVVGVAADERSAHDAADGVRHVFADVLIAQPCTSGVRVSFP